jgi:hypothetical protein
MTRIAGTHHGRRHRHRKHDPAANRRETRGRKKQSIRGHVDRYSVYRPVVGFKDYRKLHGKTHRRANRVLFNYLLHLSHPFDLSRFQRTAHS